MLPTRRLSSHPNLDQLKRQAKALLDAYRAGDATAVADVHAHYRNPDAAAFALHDAQLVLARAYGFESWPKLKAFVDGAATRTLIDAVRADDLERVCGILRRRPELVNQSGAFDERPLHYAVIERKPDIVRLLMHLGADARAGMHLCTGTTDYPSALALAAERGYDDIVGIISEEERRRGTPTGDSTTTVPPTEFRSARELWRRGDEQALIAILESHPELTQAAVGPKGVTSLHLAASFVLPTVTKWLLAQGADVNARSRVISALSSPDLDVIPPGHLRGQIRRH